MISSVYLRNDTYNYAKYTYSTSTIVLQITCEEIKLKEKKQDVECNSTYSCIIMPVLLLKSYGNVSQ